MFLEKKENSKQGEAFIYLRKPYFPSSKEGRTLIPRKAQTTAFTIAALAIIVVAIAITSLSQRSSLPQTEIPQALTLPPKAQAVHDFIAACVTSATDEALLAVGIRGGYFILPQNVLKTEIAVYPLYYADQQVFVPTQQEVTASLAAYIKDDVQNCIEERQIHGIELRFTAPRVFVQLSEGEVLARVDAPSQLAFDGTTIDLKQPYEARRSVNFLKLYTSAATVAQSTAQDPSAITLDALLSDNLQSEVTPYGSALIYMLSEPASNVGQLPVLFLFAVEVSPS